MSDTNHLQQTQLSSSAISLLNEFAVWLYGARFQDEGKDSQRCVDSDLSEKIGPLLTELGIHSLFDRQAWGYTVWRVSGQPGARFRNTPGAAYLYPIRMYEDTSPTISNKPLKVGEVTRIDHPVRVGPYLDCLFVVRM